VTEKELVKKVQAAIGVRADGVWGKYSSSMADGYEIEIVVKKKPEQPRPEIEGEFSDRSKRNLSQCHADLQRLAAEMRKEMDIEVICGFRGEKEQNEAFRKGTSKLRFPNSKHNKSPALAFDACPNPIDWDNAKAFHEMRKVAQECADRLGIKIRLISWDLPHIELA
jgi:peptidoglycan L-alanyl-D-glutamate endopeptidase CwlK